MEDDKMQEQRLFSKVLFSITGAIIGALTGSIFGCIIFFWFTGLSFKTKGSGEGIFVAGVILAALFILSFMVYGAIRGFKSPEKEIKQGDKQPMKKIVKFVLFAILFVAISDLAINAFGPVWLLRLFGYEKVIKKNCFPQWINNKEFYYLEIINYNDGGTHAGFGIIPMPYSFFTSKVPNADFLIYKVSINQPSEKKLIKKITRRANFTLSSYRKIGEEASFRISDDKKKMALIMQIPDGFLGYSYMAYFLDINGHISKKQKFDGRWSLDGKKIYGISTDLEKFSLVGHSDSCIKDISSGSLIKWDSYAKWISKDESITYDTKGYKLKIYLADEKGANAQLIYETHYSDFKEISDLLWDATISKDDSLLFLSEIGIFKKQGEEWQLIKDLKDMSFIFRYPDLSPDGQKIVGIKNGREVTVLELKDLLK